MKEKIEEYIGPVLCGIVIGLILGFGGQYVKTVYKITVTEFV